MRNQNYRIPSARRSKTYLGALALGLAVCELAACSARASFEIGGIVGGSSVEPSDSIERSVVALYQETPQGGSLCTATLIGRNFALTAAHCVEQGTQDMVVRFGGDVRLDSSLRRQNRGQAEVRVLDAQVAPQWKSQGADASDDRDLGDIALIRFEGAAPKGYHAALLGPVRRKLSEGEEVTLAGFGIDDAQSDAGAGELRKTTVKIADADFGKSEILVDQSDGSGACHGDSGGPAFIEAKGKLYLVGVTSRGYPETAPDDCRHQAVYTKVSAYRKWLSATMKGMRPPK